MGGVIRNPAGDFTSFESIFPSLAEGGGKMQETSEMPSRITYQPTQ